MAATGGSVACLEWNKTGIIIYGTKGQKWKNGILRNRVDIEKVPGDERVGTGFLNLIIYQIDISLTLSLSPTQTPPHTTIENHLLLYFLEFLSPKYLNICVNFVFTLNR